MSLRNQLITSHQSINKACSAPPHLIGASLPCQDDDVRMATATILL